MRNKGRWLAALGVLCMAGRAALAGMPEPTERIEFKITAPTLIGALLQFSDQARLQLVVPTSGAEDIPAPKVEGARTPRAALEELLRDSGLTFEFVNARTVSVSIVKARPTTGER